MRNVDDQPEGRVCGKRGVGRGIESEDTDLRIGPQTQFVNRDPRFPADV